jgi:hypothetical protein
MKISFSNHSSGALLTRNRGASRIVSFVVIGFFAGVGGCYLLENNSRVSVITMLGIAAILVCLGGAVGIFLHWSKVDRACGIPATKNVPRITSEWHYQPRKTIRAHPAADCVI